jgi:hypothetical protein
MASPGDSGLKMATTVQADIKGCFEANSKLHQYLAQIQPETFLPFKAEYYLNEVTC